VRVDGAEVGVLALLLERDDEPRRLAGPDHRGLLPVDLEVVGDVADVLEDERDLAGVAIDLVESLKKNSAPLTVTVVAVADACRSLLADPSWTRVSEAIATAPRTERERMVNRCIGVPPCE
jgi:hypothetical protein